VPEISIKETTTTTDTGEVAEVTVEPRGEYPPSEPGTTQFSFPDLLLVFLLMRGRMLFKDSAGNERVLVTKE